MKRWYYKISLIILFILFFSLFSSLKADTFRIFDLKTRLIIPSPIKGARTFNIETLTISQLGLRLKDVSISYHKDKSITLSVKKLSADVPKLLKLLKEEKLFSIDLPLKIKGSVTMKNLDLKWSPKEWKVFVQKVLVSGIETIESLGAEGLVILNSTNETSFSVKRLFSQDTYVEKIEGKLTSEGNGTLKNLTLSFFRIALDMGKFQLLAEKFLNKKLSFYLKKYLPWIALKAPNLAGKVVLLEGRFDLRYSKNQWKLHSMKVNLGNSRIKILSEGKVKGNLSIEGNFSGNATDYKFHLPKVCLALNNVTSHYNSLNVHFYKVDINLRDITGKYENSDLTLKSVLEVKQGGHVRAEGKDWVKELYLASPFYSEIALKSLKEKRFTLNHTSFYLKDKKNGEIKFSLESFYYPFSFNSTAFKLMVKNFVFNKMTVESFSAIKVQGKDVKLEIVLRKESQKFELTDGLVSYSPDLFRLQASKFKVKTVVSKSKEISPAPKSKKTSSSSPFDFTFLNTLRRVSKKWKIILESVEYENYVPFENFVATLSLEKSPYPFTIRTEVCYTSLGVAGEIEPKGKLWLSGEIQTISTPVDGFLACFLTEAPVYIRGDLTFRFSFETQGKSLDALKNAFFFQGRGDIRNGKILKISNLHKNLKWFLDILTLAKLNPTKLKDTVVFEELNFVLEGGLKEVNIKNLFISSPLLKLRIGLSGQFFLQPKFKKDLQGEVSVMGISKNFIIRDEEGKK